MFVKWEILQGSFITFLMHVPYIAPFRAFHVKSPEFSTHKTAPFGDFKSKLERILFVSE